MAHEIDMSNGRSNIALVGQPVWHGLGTILQPNQPLDVWLKHAGMEWTANQAPALFFDEFGVMQSADTNIIYRSDTKAPLGNCSDRYQIVQPNEVLEFYRDLVEREGWSLDVAGCLDGGKRIWALAKTDGNIKVNGTIDEIDTYLLLATSFDGSLSTVAKYTSVRVCCSNTLSMGLAQKGTKVSVSHSTKFNSDKVKLDLGLYEETVVNFESQMNKLADRPVTDSEAMRFIIDVLAGKNVKTEDIATRNMNIIKNVFDLYKGDGIGSTLITAQGTAYGLLQSITEYQDHRINATSINNRLRSAWFGKGENVKNLAFSEALKLAA